RKQQQQAAGSCWVDAWTEQPAASGSRHPSHLRGRDIGLFYANRQREKRQFEDIFHAPELIQLSDSTAVRLQQLLGTLVLLAAALAEIPVCLRCRVDEAVACRSANYKALKPNAQLDAKLMKELQLREKRISPAIANAGSGCPYGRPGKRLVAAVLVMSGPTGSGKSTQMSQLLIDSAIATGHGSTARVRLERKMPQRLAGSIVYCTVGILLRWLESDPSLASVSHLIVDEPTRSQTRAHVCHARRRTVLPLLRAVKRKRASVEGRLYPVKVRSLEQCLSESNFEFFSKSGSSLTSLANKNRQAMQNRLRSDRIAPREARSRLAERERELRLAANEAVKKFQLSSSHADLLVAMGCEEPPVELVAHMISYVHRTQPAGAVLVFVPGMKQIKDLITLLNSDSACSNGCHVLPLHSRLPSRDQRQVFLPAPAGKRKVVLATNIAETSLTIDDVVYVIDTGFAKLSGYHHLAMSDSLSAIWTMLDKREGRAGRVQPGVCYRLYSKFAESRMPHRLPPEVLRLSLEDFLLQVKLLHPDLPAAEFLAQMPDPPPQEHVRQAQHLLQELGALTPDEELTPMGRHIARLPLPCQLAKMVLLAVCFSCLDPVLTIAASLSHRTPFETPLGAEQEVKQCKMQLAEGCESDHLLLWLAYKAWYRTKRNRGLNAAYDFARRNYLSPTVLQTIEELKAQLTDQLAQYMSMSDHHRLELIRAVVTAGLYPNIVRCKSLKSKKAVGRPGEPSYELPQCSVACGFEEPAWLAYFEKCLLNDRRTVSLFDASLTRGRSTCCSLRPGSALAHECGVQLPCAGRLDPAGCHTRRLLHSAGSSATVSTFACCAVSASTGRPLFSSSGNLVGEAATTLQTLSMLKILNAIADLRPGDD
uniref:Helicase C-terminal domain-containing protein n=1 Tax=Macrostomum lignano TaxID=282301 RepID=A0A1I8F5E6_9PLAT